MTLSPVLSSAQPPCNPLNLQDPLPEGRELDKAITQLVNLNLNTNEELFATVKRHLKEKRLGCFLGLAFRPSGDLIVSTQSRRYQWKIETFEQLKQLLGTQEVLQEVALKLNSVFKQQAVDDRLVACYSENVKRVAIIQVRNRDEAKKLMEQKEFRSWIEEIRRTEPTAIIPLDLIKRPEDWGKILEDRKRILEKEAADFCNLIQHTYRPQTVCAEPTTWGNITVSLRERQGQTQPLPGLTDWSRRSEMINKLISILKTKHLPSMLSKNTSVRPLLETTQEVVQDYQLEDEVEVTFQNGAVTLKDRHATKADPITIRGTEEPGALQAWLLPRFCKKMNQVIAREGGENRCVVSAGANHVIHLTLVQSKEKALKLMNGEVAAQELQNDTAVINPKHFNSAYESLKKNLSIRTQLACQRWSKSNAHLHKDDVKAVPRDWGTFQIVDSESGKVLKTHVVENPPKGI